MTVAEAKDYLTGIRDLKTEIDHIRERQREVRQGLYLSGIDYTKIKVQTDHKDPKAEILNELARLQDLEVEAIINFVEKSREAYRVIAFIFDSELRMVLQLYFLNGFSMKEVAKELEYSERTLYRYYEKALKKYAEIATDMERF